jgi:NADH-quinone oxidoreductase subunit C
MKAGTALGFEALAERVRARFPAVQAMKSDNGQPFLLVPAASLPAVALLLRDDPALRCDALMDLTGCDLLKYPATPPSTAIAVVYFLFSYVHRHKVTLKVLAPREDCSVPTATGVWPAAIYFEREVWDLLGVRFAGHPSLKRIMTPEDWTGHPLRKDYVYPDDYHGVAHLRDGQHFESAPPRPGDPPPVPAPAKGHRA